MKERGGGGTALAGYGVGWLYPFDSSEVIFGVQPPVLSQQEPDLPSAGLLGWDGHLVGCPRPGHVLGAGRGPCWASISIPALMGTAAQGGDRQRVGEAFAISFPPFSSFGMECGQAPPPFSSRSPFPLPAGPGVTVPITALRSPSPRPGHCLGPVSLQSGWEEQRLAQPNPAHRSPLPPAFFPSSLP